MMSLNDSFNISNTTGLSDDYTYGNDHQSERPPYIGYLINGFIFIIISLNVPSVLVLLFTKVEKKNFTSIHILCLSLTDCGVGISLFLFMSTKTFNYWDRWARFFFVATMYTWSFNQVAVICLDRVLMLYNLTWKSVTKNSALISKIVLTTLFISMLFAFILLAVLASPHDTSTCNIKALFQENIQAARLYIGILMICVEGFIVSCIAVMILFLGKRKHSKRVKPLTNNAVQTNMDIETKAIVTLLIIVGVYVILCTPFNIFVLIAGIRGYAPGQNIGTTLSALSCLNSACNPIIYSFRIPEMKETFKATWNKVRCR